MASTIKKTSIYDIAKALNISASTVSRALQDHPSISVERKVMIRAKAKELNYRPNLVAVNLKTGRTNTIAVIVPNINRNFFASVIEGVEEEAYNRNFDVLICQTKDIKNRETHILSSLGLGKVDGIVASVALPDSDLAAYEEWVSMQMPLVFFDRSSLDSPMVGSVKLDDYKGAYNAVKHLLLQGNKRIFHFAGPQETSIWRNRFRGYRDAMEDAGIKIEEDWIYVGQTDKESGIEMTKEMLAKTRIPDAIFCAGDYAALGAILELKSRGYEVPEQISIVGFADEPMDEYVNPTITSVNQSPYRMGHLAAKMLLDNIEHNEQMLNIVIDPELKIRESSLYDKHK
ncbi:MAG: LacI family DNA-binding transcriptional regulator [Marinifilaceae bacterium]